MGCSQESFDISYKILKSIEDKSTTIESIGLATFCKVLRLAFLIEPDDSVVQFCLTQSTYTPKINEQTSIYPTIKYCTPIYRISHTCGIDRDNSSKHSKWDKNDRYGVARNQNEIGQALKYYGYDIVFACTDEAVGYNNSEIIYDLTDNELSGFNYLSMNQEEPFTCSKLNEPIYYQCDELHFPIRSERFMIFKSPKNDDERDGKILMFRNDRLVSHLQDILLNIFPKKSFYVNDVFKWNRYKNGGKFDSHYDTMFIDKEAEACSLYTLLMYLNVAEEPNKNVMYLGENGECEVKIKSNTLYIIPHWVKHRVVGEGFREFIKTEIVFPYHNKIFYNDKKVQDDFDLLCYLMLQSIRYPELKTLVSSKFNDINRFRFKFLLNEPNTEYLPIDDCILFLKTLYRLPVCFKETDLQTRKLNISFGCDGLYYYFKVSDDVKRLKDISTNMLKAFVCAMCFDIFPKKMFYKSYEQCQCSCNFDIRSLTYGCTDIEHMESITYCTPKDKLDVLQKQLPVNKIPNEEISLIGQMDINTTRIEYYFAACQNLYTSKYKYFNLKKCVEFSEELIENADGGIVLIENIIKIKQHSFKNGLIIDDRWCLDPASELEPERR